MKTIRTKWRDELGIYEDSDIMDFQDDPKFTKRFWVSISLIMAFIVLPSVVFVIVGAVTTYNYMAEKIANLF